MEMNTMTNAETHVSRVRFVCPQVAVLRLTTGAGRALQGTGVPTFGLGVKGGLRLAAISTDAINDLTHVPATFAVTDVAFHSCGSPPV